MTMTMTNPTDFMVIVMVNGHSKRKQNEDPAIGYRQDG